MTLGNGEEPYPEEQSDKQQLSPQECGCCKPLRRYPLPNFWGCKSNQEKCTFRLERLCNKVELVYLGVLPILQSQEGGIYVHTKSHSGLIGFSSMSF